MFKTNLAFLAVREGGAEGIIFKKESEVQVQLGILVLGGGGIKHPFAKSEV